MNWCVRWKNEFAIKKRPSKAPVFLFEIEVVASAIILSFSFYVLDVLANLKHPEQPS